MCRLKGRQKTYLYLFYFLCAFLYAHSCCLATTGIASFRSVEHFGANSRARGHFTAEDKENPPAQLLFGILPSNLRSYTSFRRAHFCLQHSNAQQAIFVDSRINDSFTDIYASPAGNTAYRKFDILLVNPHLCVAYL